MSSLVFAGIDAKMLMILNAMLKHRTPWRPMEAQHA
jgi:hypothetical protein